MTPTKSYFAWPLQRLQLPSHCGPCSLSACFFVLGINANQREISKAAGLLPSIRVWKTGLNDQELCRAANAYKIRHRAVMIKKETRGTRFVRSLRAHLEHGDPALLLVQDLDHWVAVLGYLKADRKFLILNTETRERGSAVFHKWSRKFLLSKAWNVSKDPAEPSQYFALLWSRRDGRKARWKLTESFVRLCERGSDDTAENMAQDLAVIARKANGGRKSIRTGRFLADILEEHRNVILKSIEEWGTGSPQVTESDLYEFYHDYETIAAASGIQISKRADMAILVSHVTSLLSCYWWGAKF